LSTSSSQTKIKELSDNIMISVSTTLFKSLAPTDIPIENSQTTTTVSQDDATLVIVSSDAQLQNIIIESEDSNISIDYSEILDASQVSISNALIIQTPTIVMQMPDSLIISSPGWNGIMKLPEITTVDLSELDTESETFTSAIAIKIGSDTEELTFSKPVRLVFIGEGGNGDVGIGFFKRANSSKHVRIRRRIISCCSCAFIKVP